jgi:hypothetical protein
MSSLFMHLGEKPVDMVNPSLILIWIDVIACLIHGLKEGGTLMGMAIIHLPPVL